MKKIICLGTLLLVLAGCATNKAKENTQSVASFKEKSEKKYSSYLDGLTLENAELIQTKSSSIYDVSQPLSLKKATSYIFLARVTSIDGAEGGGVASTYGKLKVLENIEGKTQEEVDFVRIGGTIKVKDYYREAGKEEQNKAKSMRKEKGLQDPLKDESYMTFKEEGDISLESGKEYLFFANYDKEKSRYILVGFQFGSLILEENGEKVEDVPLESGKEDEVVVGRKWEVKNKSNGKKIKLATYLEKELNIKNVVTKGKK